MVKWTHADSEFCVAIPQTKESGLKVVLAADLEKLTDISKSRFRQKIPESKLKSKMYKYPVPENCPDVSPPTLNSELTDKGYVDRTTKKSDGRLVNVQTMLSAATSCLLVEIKPIPFMNMQLTSQVKSAMAQHTQRAAAKRLVLQNGR